MTGFIGLEFLAPYKVLLAILLVFVLTYYFLKKSVFPDDDTASVSVAIIASVIVSFTGGIVTYFISYTIPFLVLVLFLIFGIFLVCLFMGYSMDKLLFNARKKKILIPVIIFVGFFLLIIGVNSYCALEKQFEEPLDQDDIYDPDICINTGVGGIVGGISNSVSENSQVVPIIAFILIVGGIIFMMTRKKNES